MNPTGCTLLERAERLLEDRTGRAAALALTTLAAAPAAQAVAGITITGGTVDYMTPPDGGDPFGMSGGALTTFGGTNGTDSVKLAGSATLTNNNSNGLNDNSITFENLGTIDAAAGQFVRVEFDFDQVFDSSSGGDYDISYELDLFVDEDGQNITANASGLDALLVGGAPTTVPRSGSFDTAPFAADLSAEDLRLVLKGEFVLADGGGRFGTPFDSTSVVVPQSSITLSVIPEPTTWLMAIALAGALLWSQGRSLCRHLQGRWTRSA